MALPQFLLEGELPFKTPLESIKQYADSIKRSTKGVLIGTVDALPGVGDDLVIRLWVTAPKLGHYKISLAEYKQPPELFPGRLRNIAKDSQETVRNIGDFEITLEDAMRSEKVQTIINALVRQSKALASQKNTSEAEEEWDDDPTPPPPPSRTR